MNLEVDFRRPSPIWAVKLRQRGVDVKWKFLRVYLGGGFNICDLITVVWNRDGFLWHPGRHYIETHTYSALIYAPTPTCTVIHVHSHRHMVRAHTRTHVLVHTHRDRVWSTLWGIYDRAASIKLGVTNKGVKILQRDTGLVFPSRSACLNKDE